MSGRPVIVRGTKMRDRTGEVCGPYVLTHPVGANPLKSEYWNLRCATCAHTPKPLNAQGLARIVHVKKRCPGCGAVSIAATGTAKPMTESEGCGAS